MTASFPLTILKHKRIAGVISVKSGLRIGPSEEAKEIGGVDNPTIRDPATGLPYIPGSSLKGKLRSLLEFRLGKVGQNGSPCQCANCNVCRVFGPHFRPNHDLGPTRIIVRDAFLTEASRAELERRLAEDLGQLEVKTENMILRHTGRATNPRQTERVLRGMEFDFEILLRIFQGDNEQELVAFVTQGLELLKNEALGASGSRGYGWVDVTYTVADA